MRSETVYLVTGMILGGVLADLEIGYWSWLVAGVIGLLIGVTQAIWERRFS